MSKKWQIFTYEQLLDKFKSAKNQKEFLISLGYSSSSAACGRSMKEISEKYPDITYKQEIKIGDEYGKLKVLGKDNQRDGGSFWNCQCECGAITSVRADHLKRGDTKSCGECWKSLIGKTFGQLEVIAKTDKRYHSQVIWKCRCSCGAIIETAGGHLVDGTKKSCGCFNQMEDLTNQVFGFLTAQYYTGQKDKDGRPIWHCKCACGNEKDVDAHCLKSGGTRSCGCIGKSYGERMIEDFLKENHIKYIKEYMFPDLVGQDGHTKLRFDFAIFQGEEIKKLIEYQGIQHFQPIEYFGGEAAYQRQIENDQKKKNYCEEKQIPLYCISYMEVLSRENLMNLFLDFSQKI